MSNLFTFHQTVRGHMHIMKDMPCQDSSASFKSDNRLYHIAVVADGHGSKAYFRSDIGSKIAVDVTLKCLKEFAEATLQSKETEERFYKDFFTNPRYNQMTMRHLTDVILSQWYDKVLEHYQSDPPSVEEMGQYANDYQNGKKIPRIYGTTLIAALQLPECIILLHQGDGRCDVFYEDGTVNQPIPWDPRCEGTSTTSLCEPDAADSFRSCALNLNDKPVIACFLGCDGVEDAYRDTYDELGNSHCLMGGVHTFYKYLICQAVDMDKNDFAEWMEGFLSEFSANGIFSKSGSGDDVSVAGIMDMDKIPEYVDRFAYDTKLYSLEESLFLKEDELRSKMRKHGILKKRFEEAKNVFESAIVTHAAYEADLGRIKEEHDSFAERVKLAKAELEEYRRDAESVSGQIDGKYSRLGVAIQHFMDEIITGCSQSEATYSKMLEKLLDYDAQIKQVEEVIVQSRKRIAELEEKKNEAQRTFDEYDEKFKAIESECDTIKNEILNLKNRTDQL